MNAADRARLTGDKVSTLIEAGDKFFDGDETLTVTHADEGADLVTYTYEGDTNVRTDSYWEFADAISDGGFVRIVPEALPAPTGPAVPYLAAGTRAYITSILFLDGDHEQRVTFAPPRLAKITGPVEVEEGIATAVEITLLDVPYWLTDVNDEFTLWAPLGAITAEPTPEAEPVGYGALVELRQFRTNGAMIDVADELHRFIEAGGSIRTAGRVARIVHSRLNGKDWTEDDSATIKGYLAAHKLFEAVGSLFIAEWNEVTAEAAQ